MPDDDKKPKFPWTLVIILILVIIIVYFIIYPPAFVKHLIEKGKATVNKAITNAKDLTKFEWTQQTQVVEKEEPKGVEINDFRSKDKINYIGEPIEMTSTVSIYGLKENIATYVSLKCESSEGNEGAIFVSDEEGSKIEIKPQETKTLNVDCKFDELTEGTNKIKLSANYENFKSRAELKVYTLKKEKLDSLGTTDAFSYYKINEPLRKSDKIMKSTYSFGPLILTLNLGVVQPIDEIGSYRLYVNLKEDTSWKGKLDKLRSVQLIFPSKFTATDNCDFGNDLIIDESELEGIELKDNGKDYWCIFKVDEADEKLTSSSIKLQVAYDYIFEKETNIEVKPILV